MLSVPRCYKQGTISFESSDARMKVGSNTSTVTLRVVGYDEKGSLKFETVKYGHESQGTRTRERLRCQGPAAYSASRQKGRPQETRP
jgi:hypothetical protein